MLFDFGTYKRFYSILVPIKDYDFGTYKSCYSVLVPVKVVIRFWYLKKDFFSVLVPKTIDLSRM